MKQKLWTALLVGVLALLAACTPLRHAAPASDNAAAATSEPAAEPTAEPTTAPAAEATAEPAAEPESEPTAEPVAEAATESEDAEQTADDADYYAMVTAMDKAAVEETARAVREAYLNQDWPAIVDMIRYPITMDPDVEVSNGDELLAYMDGKTLHESDAAAMEAETCTDMFFNGQGICMGDGEIWLIDPNYMTDGQPILQIIALRGFEEAGE